MKVNIKKFGLDLSIKSRGIELQVSDTKGKQLGDIILTNTEVIWCPGKTGRASPRAKHHAWKAFIDRMSAP